MATPSQGGCGGVRGGVGNRYRYLFRRWLEVGGVRREWKDSSQLIKCRHDPRNRYPDLLQDVDGGEGGLGRSHDSHWVHCRGFLSFLCTPATGLLSPKSHMLLQQVLE